ncbi:MAG: hypothetical protein JW709_11115 [Sedimentisphaerales bacterium]|nr:hypothetical protein [Sedimentisphaerales bacterium]
MRSTFDTKINQVQRRCWLNTLLQAGGEVTIVAGAVAGVGILVSKLFSLSWSGQYFAFALVATSLAVIAALAWLRRPSRLQAAMLCDERLGLKERFSTVLALREMNGPFIDATRRETTMLTEKIHPGGFFPVRPTRTWIWAGGVWVLALLTLLYMPQQDLLGILQRRQEEENNTRLQHAAQAEVRQTVRAVDAAVKQLQDPQLASALEDMKTLPDNLRPNDLKRQVIRKLGDMSEQITQTHLERNQAALDVMQAMMKQLPNAPDGMTSRLQQALAQGDFKKAADMADQMRKDLKDKKLTPEQQKQLTEQLRKLSEKLSEMAKRNEEMQKELEKHGLDKDLAKLDPEKLRQQLQKMGIEQNLIETLMKKASACSQACQSCEQLSQAMAQAAGEGDESGLSEAEMEALADQLSDMEAMQAQSALAQESLDEIYRAIQELGQNMCQGQGCQGCNGCGWGKPGMGAGGGQGEGIGLAPGSGATDNEFFDVNATKSAKTKSQVQEGPIVATWYFKDEQVKGEAHQDFSTVVEAAQSEAADAIAENRIPKKYEKAVKQYFGQLETQTPVEKEPEK